MVFSLIFGLGSAYAANKGWDPKWATVWGALSLFAFCVTVLKPSLIAPLNLLWFQFGILLGKIVSPVALSLLFFLIITPTAVIGRLLGRDELRLKKKNVTSYWVNRDPVTTSSESFRNQY